MGLESGNETGEAKQLNHSNSAKRRIMATTGIGRVEEFKMREVSYGSEQSRDARNSDLHEFIADVRTNSPKKKKSIGRKPRPPTVIHDEAYFQTEERRKKIGAKDMINNERRRKVSKDGK